MRRNSVANDSSIGPTSWRLFGFGFSLVLAMGIGPFVVHSVSVLSPIMRNELDLSRAQIGALSATQFFSAMLVSSRAGGLTDRFGGRRMIAVLFVTVAVCLGVIAAAPTYPVLVVALFLIGIPMAASNPATNFLVARFLPPGRQGAMLGVKQSGVTFCTMLAGLLLPSVASGIGWRLAMLTGALLGLGGLAVLYKTVDQDVTVSQEQRANSAKGDFGGIRWLGAYAFLMGCGGAVFTVYLPLYAVEGIGLSIRAAGFMSAVGALVAVISRVIWGMVAERLESPLLPLLALSSASLPGLILILVATPSTPWAVWTGVVLFGLSGQAWNSVAMGALVQGFSSHSLGKATGLVIRGFYGGFVAAPIAAGVAIDRSGDYRTVWIGSLSAVLLAIAVVLWRWSFHRNTPLDAPQAVCVNLQ